MNELLCEKNRNRGLHNVMNNGQRETEPSNRPRSSDYYRTNRSANRGLTATATTMHTQEKLSENRQPHFQIVPCKMKAGPLPNVCSPHNGAACTEYNQRKNVPSQNTDMQIGDSEDMEKLNSKLRSALEENIRLRSVIHDVTEVNKRWQKYNQERQGYVQKLLTTIKELQQKEVSNTELIARAQEAVSLQEKPEQLKQENAALHRELVDSEQRCRQLNDALAITREDLKERIGLLEMQVKMQIEDFNTEKTEKAEALKTAEHYREENQQLKIQLLDLEKDHKSSKVYVCTCQNHNRQGVFCKIAELQKRQVSSHHHEVQVLPCQLIPRSSSVNDLYSMNNATDIKLKSKLDVNCKKMAAISKHTMAHKEQKEARWLLMCPKCRKYFPPNMRMQFLSHVDHCEEETNYRCSQ